MFRGVAFAPKDHDGDETTIAKPIEIKRDSALGHVFRHLLLDRLFGN